MTDLLSSRDKRFAELLFNYLLWYNKKNSKVTGSSPQLSQDASEFLELRKTAFQDKRAIRNYVSDPAARLSAEDHTLMSRMDHCIMSTFIMISVNRDTVHLLYSPEGASYILQVTPWSTEALMNFESIGLPRYVDAALFPSDSGIMYDLLDVKSVTFGPGIKKSIRDDGKTAKAKHGIIKTLPIPVSTEDTDLVDLRGLMNSKSSIIENWDQIQDIITRKPDLMTEYYQKLGAAYIRMRRKDLKQNGIFGWFALYGWTVIAGGKTREITDSAARGLVSEEHYDRLVFFEVKI